MSYVDGFIVAVPKGNIEAYKEFSTFAGSIWKEYGALEYVECIGDDVPYGELTSFPPRRAGEGGRGGGVFLDRLRLAPGARRYQCQGDG
jgi:uncharacterized protein YbaA (DUF1428 family)